MLTTQLVDDWGDQVSAMGSGQRVLVVEAEGLNGMEIRCPIPTI